MLRPPHPVVAPPTRAPPLPDFFFLFLTALAHPPQRKKGVTKKNSGEHARSEVGYSLIDPKGTASRLRSLRSSQPTASKLARAGHVVVGCCVMHIFTLQRYVLQIDVLLTIATPAFQPPAVLGQHCNPS